MSAVALLILDIALAASARERFPSASVVRQDRNTADRSCALRIRAALCFFLCSTTSHHHFERLRANTAFSALDTTLSALDRRPFASFTMSSQDEQI